MINALAPFGRGVVRYYAAQLRRVLGTPLRLVSLCAAAVLHAAGHAMVALLAGAMAVAMARMWGMGELRSSPFGQDAHAAKDAFWLALVALLVLTVKAVAGVYATYVQARAAAEVGGALRLELLGALLSHHRVRAPRHDDQGEAPSLAPEPPLARGVSALTERVREVESGLELGLLGGLRSVAQLVPLAAVLVVLSPRMALVAGGALAIFGLALARTRRGTQRAASREASERERLLEAADESVRHAELWVSYGAEDKARARVGALGLALAKGTARLRARAAALSAANEVLGALALLLAIGAARAGWLGTVADGPRLLAFAVAFFLAYRPLRELADARLALDHAEAAYSDLRAVMASGGRDDRGTSDDRVEEAEAEAAWGRGALELRGLRLARGACAPLSLRVEAGKCVAIAGPTGVGKTTLLRTLLGLEAPAGGEVTYDGKTLHGAPAGPVGRPFAWVPQDAPLLADTLAENVALGSDEVVDPRGALDPLGAAHLAEALGDGRLGAGGRAVSGGERQWIALARAIATRQPVLLLDEPTSGLDHAAQGRVLDAIARLKGHRTVVMVTHRPEPLAVADLVVRV